MSKHKKIAQILSGSADYSHFNFAIVSKIHLVKIACLHCAQYFQNFPQYHLLWTFHDNLCSISYKMVASVISKTILPHKWPQ